MAVIRLHRVHELPASPTPAPADARPAAESHPLPFERWTERRRRATVTR